MKKRKIILVATGLSAGMLLSSTVVNVPIVWGLNSVQVVKADEISKDEMDPNLVWAITDRTTLSLEWTIQDLRDYEDDIDLSGRGLSDVDGLNHAVSANSIDLRDNHISNFDPLSGLDESKITIGNQIIDAENYAGSWDRNMEFISLFHSLFGYENRDKLFVESILIDGNSYDDYRHFDLPTLMSSGIKGYRENGEVVFVFKNIFGKSESYVTVNTNYKFHVGPSNPVINVEGKKIKIGTQVKPYDCIISASDILGDLDLSDYSEAIDYDLRNVSSPGIAVDFDSFSAVAGEYEVDYWFKYGSENEKVTAKIIVYDDDNNVEEPGDVDGEGDGKPSDGNNSGSSSGGGGSSKIEDIAPTNIMTDKKSLPIYNVNGNKLEPKTLTKQTTDFVTEKLNTVGDNKFYRIGENEWVNTKDVKVFHYNDGFKQTHGDSHKELTQFRNRGMVENRALKSASSWVTDRYAMFGTEKYHRVATHEWVHDDHVVKYTPISGIVGANENAQLYNSRGNKSNRGLIQGSRFVTDRTATINSELMYRVATDEWVSASSVTLD